jgi:hypothetical protein
MVKAAFVTATSASISTPVLSLVLTHELILISLFDSSGKKSTSMPVN